MTVRKLKPKQRGPLCSYCDERAIWRGFMHRRFACEAHHANLAGWDDVATTPDHSDAAFYERFA